MAANTVPEDQLIELLVHLHKTKPEEARSILNAQPQISYALISLMVRLNAINVEAMTTQLSSYGVPTGPTTSASFVNTPAPASRPYDSTANPSSYQPPETPHDTRMPYVVPSQTSHPSGPPGYPHGNQSQPATSSTSRTNYVNSSAQNPSLVPTPSQQGYPQSGQSGPTGWAARTSGHSGQGPTYEGSGANLSYGAGPGGNYGGGQNGNYSGGQADTYGGAQGAGYGRGVPGGYGNGPGGDYGGSRGSYGSAGRGGPYGGRAQSGTYGGAHGRNGPGPGPQGYGHPPPASPAAQPPSMTVPEGLAHLPEEQKALLMRMVAMTPDEIHRLPPAERANVIQLRATLGLPTS